MTVLLPVPVADNPLHIYSVDYKHNIGIQNVSLYVYILSREGLATFQAETTIMLLLKISWCLITDYELNNNAILYSR